MNPGRLDGARLVHRLGELSSIGRTPAGGVTRLAYSRADCDGRSLVATWMAEAGLEVVVDAACNLIGWTARPTADRPAVVVGSHLDTVVDGGRLDGSYGVVAGVEIAAALAADRSAGDVPFVVVAFANEEGAAGSQPFDGSRAVVGTPNPLTGTDRDGRTLAERVDGAGGDSTALRDAAWPAGSVRAYLEVHIEQGPVLDRAGVPLGLVTAVTGRRNVDIVVEGAANHAGTTPMDLRRDALTAAARVVLEVERLATSGSVRVATTGAVRVAPGARNVVPGRVELEVDLRDEDDGRLDIAVTTLTDIVHGIAAAAGVTAAVDVVGTLSPTPTDAALEALFEQEARRAGHATCRLPSGAGHDAQTMAALGPVGMLFVPSRDGISHSPLEHTDPHHLVAGADVLHRAVRHLLDGALRP